MNASLNGIWRVEIVGADDWEAVSTAFLEGGRYLAGSESHYTVGKYSVSDNRVEITATGERHGQGRTMFGKKQESLGLTMKGEIKGDEIEGAVRDRDTRQEISFRLSRIADLP